MSEQSIESTLGRELGLRRKPTFRTQFFRFVRTKPLGALGGFILMAAILTAIFAPLIAPYSVDEFDRSARLSPPSASHIFGTDHIARDVFSRVVFGSRVSLLVGFIAVASSTVIGTLLGVASAYFGKTLDLLLQRVVDSLQALPGLVLALTLIAALGPSLFAVILAITIVRWPGTTRTVRSVALSIKSSQYVDAARAIGASDLRIMLRHITPNVMAPVIVIGSAVLGGAIVTEASLSFLGLGVPPNIPTWGNMLGTAQQRYIAAGPWTSIFPGVALTITVFGVNILGDAIRDVLDPRLRGSR
jgi:peptide/nickel transport system permease protein